MATVTICDVKTCGDVIKGKPVITPIGNKKYELCSKCSEGLIKFLDENLNNSTAPALDKIIPATMEELFRQSARQQAPAEPWGSPIYIPTFTANPTYGTGTFRLVEPANPAQFASSTITATVGAVLAEAAERSTDGV